MIQTGPTLSKADMDIQCRKALAKVYSLLIKLAEELDESSSNENKTVEPAANNPVPLKSNIPLGQ